MQAKDIMTSNVITVNEDSLVHDIVALLLKHRISAVPVLDKQGRVVGIVSEGDLLAEPKGIAGKPAWWLSALMLGGSIDYQELHASTAAEVMTSPVIVVQQTASLAGIARILESEHIKRVPVLDGETLVGIVSRANLMHGLAHAIIEEHEPGAASDRAIRARVVDALAHNSLSDAHMINVTVRNGSVQLWGVIDNEQQRQLAEKLAAEAAGTDAVESNLARAPASGLPL